MSKPKIVYLIPGAKQTYQAVLKGQAARERLFGAIQLIERGWDITFSDAQQEGWGASFRMKVRRWIELPSLSMLLELWRRDIAIIQGRLAPLFLLIAKSFGVKVLYVDVMFDMPKRRIKKLLYKLCLTFADGILCYSVEQPIEWSKIYNVPIKKMSSARFPMDAGFYNKPDVESAFPPFAIAIGRDVGRDFSTLIKASNISGVDVKMVTLPYLLPEDANQSRVEIFQNLSYEKLFELYARAKLAVVPLKPNISYPSGIRACLEAMLLKVPLVATYTNVLAEEFVDGEHLLYVESNNPEQLSGAILKILNDPEMAERLTENAWRKVTEDFGVNQFANKIESLMSQFNN